MRLHARGTAWNLDVPVVGRVTGAEMASLERRVSVRVTEHARGAQADDCLAVICRGEVDTGSEVPGVYGLHGLDYLAAGDVVALHPSGIVDVLYSPRWRHNTILLTERCNSLCVMCSQPPRSEDDSWRVPVIDRALGLIDQECLELGFTGGEPLLLGDAFFTLIERAKQCLPRTALHVLTNGRLFRNPDLARRLADVEHPDLMLGIPLYSDVDDEHDFVVQARGAYAETVQGLLNLGERSVPIELRIVLHKGTYRRLPELAEFIARNLPFVSHVAFMGLEMYGYVHRNLDIVWTDPADYQDELERATTTLALHGIEAVIFNHQLCVLRRRLWPFAVKSISDWKNVYLPACEGCAARAQCGGFFQSGTKQYSAAIHPLREQELEP